MNWRLSVATWRTVCIPDTDDGRHRRRVSTASLHDPLSGCARTSALEAIPDFKRSTSSALTPRYVLALTHHVLKPRCANVDGNLRRVSVLRLSSRSSSVLSSCDSLCSIFSALNGLRMASPSSVLTLDSMTYTPCKLAALAGSIIAVSS